MSNARELLARLNPTTVKFDIGRGGQPQLTNQDIAGALAFVSPGLGRSLLEACWWSDGAARSRKSMRNEVMALVVPELQRQSRALSHASLDLQLVKAAIAWSGRGATAEQSRELASCEARLEQVRAGTWPRTTVESLPTLVSAVIDEIAHPHRCERCEGRGHVMAGELKVTCLLCDRTGLAKVSGRRRAHALGINERSYRDSWAGIYQWLLDAFRDAEQQAARQLSDALRDESVRG
ncbi:hypothetical protein [Pseudoxanthomonas dokdonensis]|uniref:Uncharacterized protein n=1 Tax=Pseudoxanthomonas dokdonensis TaxID=344882 RepID=A0A0R0CH39_9GAMM|nr:hypothetical protein [Pseudoxanthomonas dokdonensis]KRG69133.1 hypothetical protein ABB29_12050 [Pseudoxanthomonas dokdonensis]